MKVTNCSALRDFKCANGFPVNAGCQTVETSRISWTPCGAVPVCMDEGNCGQLYPETGRPSVAQQAEGQAE